MRAKGMVGLRFGRLVVVGGANPKLRKKGRILTYLCKCDCGGSIVSRGDVLRKGDSSSCGCLISEGYRSRFTVHGHRTKIATSPTYRTWQSMLDRVLGSDDQHAKYYRDRGITVCERWAKFENFLADMGERPMGKTIDRIDNNGNYEPGNCKWSTPKEQRANQRPRQLAPDGRAYSGLDLGGLDEALSSVTA